MRVLSRRSSLESLEPQIARMPQPSGSSRGLMEFIGRRRTAVRLKLFVMAGAMSTSAASMDVGMFDQPAQKVSLTDSTEILQGTL